MFFGDFVYGVFQLGRNVGDDEVLIGGQAEVAGVDFGDFAHAGFQRSAGVVEQAAVFDKQGQVPVAFEAFNPADVVAAMSEGVGANGFELDAHALFNFFFEYFDADALECVAGTCGFAVAAVAPVALGADDGFGGVEGIFEGDETEFVGGVGVGFGVAVFAGQPAADKDVEADKFAVFFDGDKA